MSIYPESMRPTRASNTIIVREANEVIFQAAQGIAAEGTGKFNNKMTDLAKAAVLFLKGKK